MHLKGRLFEKTRYIKDDCINVTIDINGDTITTTLQKNSEKPLVLTDELQGGYTRLYDMNIVILIEKINKHLIKMSGFYQFLDDEVIDTIKKSIQDIERNTKIKTKTVIKRDKRVFETYNWQFNFCCNKFKRQFDDITNNTEFPNEAVIENDVPTVYLAGQKIKFKRCPHCGHQYKHRNYNYKVLLINTNWDEVCNIAAHRVASVNMNSERLTPQNIKEVLESEERWNRTRRCGEYIKHNNSSGDSLEFDFLQGFDKYPIFNINKDKNNVNDFEKIVIVNNVEAYNIKINNSVVKLLKESICIYGATEDKEKYRLEQYMSLEGIPKNERVTHDR